MTLAYVFPSYRRPEVAMFLVENITRQTINRRLGYIKIVISVDSIDPLLEKYKSYVDQLDFIYRQKLPFLNITIDLLINDTSGLVAAKNSAIKSVNTDYVMMLDDDLYMEEDYVERLYDDLSTNEDVAAVSGYIISSVPAISHTQPSSLVAEIPKDGAKLQTLEVLKNSGEWRSVFGKKEQVMDWSKINSQIPSDKRYEMDYFVNSYMFKTELAEKIGNYNEKLNSKTSAHEEVEFTYRLGRSGYTLLFNPHARMWHITIGKGGIYKGKDYTESKMILEKEYNESLPKFLRSISDKVDQK